MVATSLYGLLGKDLSHSFSEKYFREKFAREGITDAAYRNFPIAAIEDLPRLLIENPNIKGFNVTIPYKESIISYLSEIDEEAARIGAVNCVVAEWGGGGVKFTGYNTDAPAFRDSLLGLIGDERPSALVLGTGGASKAVCHVLSALDIDYSLVSRTPKSSALGYEDLTAALIADNRLIINTTPLGTWPLTDRFPNIPYESLTPRHFLFDLVYNPDPTEFLLKGKACGATTQSGMEMLIGQAERSWEIWR